MLINSQRFSFQAMAMVPFQTIAMVSKIKVTKVSPAGFEIPLSKVIVNLTHAMEVTELSTKTIRETIESAVMRLGDTTIAVYYKDRTGDLILVTDALDVWPVDDCVHDTIKAWYRSAPPPPNEGRSSEAVALKRAPTTECLGPHIHQPAGKRAKILSEVDFNGYSMLEAASMGCASCVAIWLDRGQDVNFASKTHSYTAMDFVLWSENQYTITPKAANAVKSVLKKAGGKSNHMVADP